MPPRIVYSNTAAHRNNIRHTLYHIADGNHTNCGRAFIGWSDKDLVQIDGITIDFCRKCGTLDEFQTLLDAFWAQEKAERAARIQQIELARASRARRHSRADDIIREIFGRMGVEGTINPITGFGKFTLEEHGETFEIELRVC